MINFRTLAWSAALLASFGAWRSGHAQIIPPSVLPGLPSAPRREYVDVDQPPWRGVVRVQTEVGVHCTGALVGQRLVLTAAHCLFGRGTGRVVRPASVHILTGYSHGQFAGHARAVSVEIGAGFGLGTDGQRLPAAPADADWAVLTVDAPLGTADRILPLAPLAPVGSPLMLGGYEQDRAQVLVADVDCHVLGVVDVGAAHLLRHNCAATRGASGAPLLERIPDAGWGVVGVASAAGIGAAGGYAVPASTIAARSGLSR